MKSKIEVGMRWGCIRVIASSEEWKVYARGPGVEERKRMEKFLCACDCGREFEIWADEWKGKRKLKDCGCGRSLQDGLAVNFSVSMPMRYVVWLRNEGVKRGVSKSAVLLGILKEHISREEKCEDTSG